MSLCASAVARSAAGWRHRNCTDGASTSVLRTSPSKDDDFAAVVADWLRRGLVHEWTDTFDVFGRDGRTTTSGPMRFATRDGLRSLARDLHGEVTSRGRGT